MTKKAPKKPTKASKRPARKKLSKIAARKAPAKKAQAKKRVRINPKQEAIYEEEWASNWDDDAADFSEEE